MKKVQRIHILYLLVQLYNKYREVKLRKRGGDIVLSIRCQKVLVDLLNASYPISVKCLMEKYGVSERSIKYDIEKLRTYLAENSPDVKLVYQTRCGFSLEATSSALYVLQQMRDAEPEKSLIFSSERIRHIVITLLLMRDYITLQSLADILQVSKDTVLRDMEAVDGFFYAWNICLERRAHHGVRLVTTESKRRQAIAYFILSTFELPDMEKTIAQFWHGAEAKKLQKTICRYLMTEEEFSQFYRSCRTILREMRTMRGNLQAKELLELFIRICVAFHAVRSGGVIEPTESGAQWRPEVRSQMDCRLQALFAEFDRSITRDELDWLALPLAHTYAASADFSVEGLVHQMIRRTSEVMELPFEADGELYENLLLHMQRILIKKQSYAINVNPLVDDIRRRFGHLFETVKQVCYDLFDASHIYLHDDDISSIVLYFRLSYETLFGNTYVRTLVVCSSGISSAKLLMRQLQNTFDVLQIVGCCSITEVERVVAENSVELIISVLPLHSHLPCIVVQAILQERDIEKIRTTLAELCALPNTRERVRRRQGVLQTDERQSCEHFAEEVICGGFHLFGQVMEIVGRRLEPQREKALLLHCLLAANRFAGGSSYAWNLPSIMCGVEMTKLATDIRSVLREYDPKVSDSEVEAILTYFVEAEG